MSSPIDGRSHARVDQRAGGLQAFSAVAGLLPHEPHRLSRWLKAIWLCLLWSGWAAAAPPDQPAVTPFLRFRDTPLGYHGPSEDFTNLTELRLGWFGPTNSNDPLNGDLWWAANYAIQEANAHQMTNGAARDGEHTRPRVSRPASSPVGPASPSNVAGEAPATPPETGALPFRLVPRWAVDPWGTGVSQLSRMVYDEQPLALLGSVDSASTHLAEQVAAKAQLPVVSPITTDKTVTLAGVSWMFACAPSDAAIARVLVEAVLATLQGQSAIRNPQPAIPNPQSPIPNPQSAPLGGLALLTCTDHESRMTTRELLKEFSRRGRLPDFRFDVPPGAPDFSRQLAALAEARPAVVLISAGPEDAARLVRALRTPWTTNAAPLTPSLSPSGGAGARKAGEGEPRPLVFGTHSFGRTRFLQLAGPAAEGIRFPLLFVPDASDPVTARFFTEFKAARGHPPDYAAALTYDATRLLVEAVRRAGPNRARIRDALHQLSPWRGIAGVIQFDGTGQNSRTNVCLGIIRDGAMVPYHAVDAAPRTTSKEPTL